MSKKEILKEDIDIIKKLLHLFLVSFFGVGAYVFINAKNLSLIEIVIALFAAVCLIVAELITIKKYLKARKELEKL